MEDEKKNIQGIDPKGTSSMEKLLTKSPKYFCEGIYERASNQLYRCSWENGCSL